LFLNFLNLSLPPFHFPLAYISFNPLPESGTYGDQAKKDQLIQSIEELRQTLANQNEDGTVNVKVPQYEVEEKIQRLEAKLAKFENKEKGIPTEPKQKTRKEEDIIKEEFGPYYLSALEENGSPCLAYAQKTATEAKRLLSAPEKAKKKLDAAKCKLEKAELYHSFVLEREQKKQEQQATLEQQAPNTQAAEGEQVSR